MYGVFRILDLPNYMETDGSNHKNYNMYAEGLYASGHTVLTKCCSCILLQLQIAKKVKCKFFNQQFRNIK